MRARRLFAALVALGLASSAATAGEADVLEVEVTREAGGTYRFDVTVAHADEGWDHYADRFEVLGPDGALLGTRTLLHPHENEQPFTRSLTGVVVPPGLDRVHVRAHDSVHDYGGAELDVPLPSEES